MGDGQKKQMINTLKERAAGLSGFKVPSAVEWRSTPIHSQFTI
jgi:hypothetical protein